MEPSPSLKVFFFFEAWKEELDLGPKLSEIEQPRKVIHDFALPPVSSANNSDIRLVYPGAATSLFFFFLLNHIIIICWSGAVAQLFQKDERMPENAPCCVLEVFSPSAVRHFALVSQSFPAPNVQNIRPTAKQHNVVQLTCSPHNLALSATLSIWSICLRSHTRVHVPDNFFYVLNSQALSW